MTTTGAGDVAEAVALVAAAPTSAMDAAAGPLGVLAALRVLGV